MQPHQIKFWREICAKRASQEFARRISPDEIVASNGRCRREKDWRFFSIALLRAHDFSLTRIAAILGYKDHTSVLNGLRRAVGHDGKLGNEPLWKTEHFKKIALMDEASFIGVEWVAA
jgi:hypothetical protein